MLLGSCSNLYVTCVLVFIVFCICLYCVLSPFVYIYLLLFCLDCCKDYCHRVTTQLQWIIIIIIIIIIIYLLTPCSNLTGLQLVKKFPAFHGTRRFITAFTSARHLSLSWASSIQSIPLQPSSWKSILMLSSDLRLGLPSGLSSVTFLLTKTCTHLSHPHTRYMPRPYHSSQFYHPYSSEWAVQINNNNNNKRTELSCSRYSRGIKSFKKKF
jgi:hypothetical protein